MLGRNTKAACHFTRTLQEALRPVCSPWYPEGSTQAPTQGAYYGVTLCTQRTGDSTDASVLPWPFKHPRHSASGTNTHTEKAIRFVLLQTGRGGSGNGIFLTSVISDEKDVIIQTLFPIASMWFLSCCFQIIFLSLVFRLTVMHHGVDFFEFIQFRIHSAS